ncbi:ABC transporter permease [Nonomuraea sp. SYSU D8015]|uniref:ABC transporter permease n=1 Tax=Nonomuraea sp. SYSU D8015 TaxID=2593644 RepID=UPI001660DB1F|nr:ABC transporter permease [Nonomuraea sp. SYSU D8015]
MYRFVLRRLVFALLVLWLVSVAVFVLFFVAPHDPARMIAGRLATPETVALVRHRLGLDQPVLEQYLHFLGGLLHGDLGYSYYNSEPVTTLIAERIPVTLSLTLGAAIIWLLLGVAAGVIAARRPGTVLDRGITALVLAGLSTPPFLLGLLFLYVLFFRLHLAGVDWFPGGGYTPLTQDPLGWAQHLILPWLTLAVVSAATYARLTRTSLLEVLGEDYVRTARAKGVTERRVVYRHGLRAALTPVVTQLGIDVGTLLGGAIVTESVFGLPGLGQLAVQSVTTQDLPVIIGIVLLAALFIVLANIVVDAGYALLDPRVRLA